jgi:ATP-dependent helicase HrpA
VAYAYAPGEDQDGVTLRLTVPLASVVDPEKLEWAVPSLRMERVAQLLRLLPKALRRSLMPLPATARAIIEAIPTDSDAFLEGMTHFIRQRYGIEIPRSAWSVEALPPHLRPRFEIVGAESGAPLVGRDLADMVRRLPRADPTQSELWRRAASKWERYDLTIWDLGDVPEYYVIGEIAGLPVFAYPGLQWDQEGVSVRLFPDRALAGRATREGWSRLAERVLHRELAWVQKDLRALQDVKVLYVTLGSGDELMATAWENLRRYLLPSWAGAGLAASEFEAYLDRARQRLPGLAKTLMDRVRLILQRRQEALMHRRPFPGMKQEIDALLPSRFLEQIPFERLAHVPRYLQALVVRAERAALNPAKDAERARQIEPFMRAWTEGMNAASGKPDALEAWAAFRWQVEEFKVSCFAQELGTAVPVSPKRLATALDEVRRAVSGPNAAGTKG